MIRLNVLYPNEEGHFNLDYYLNTHISLVKQTLGTLLKGIEVYQGKSDATDGKAPFMICACLFFENMEACQQSFTEYGETLMADIDNFSNIAPVIQIEDQLHLD